MRSRTLILIIGILVALMISFNSGLIKLSDLTFDRKDIKAQLKELLADNSSNSKKINSLLQLSEDLPNLYKKISK